MNYLFEVRAAGLSETSRFRTKYTLQFPRVERIRDDKIWHDCCTLKEFEDLYSVGWHYFSIKHINDLFRILCSQVPIWQEQAHQKYQE